MSLIVSPPVLAEVVQDCLLSLFAVQVCNCNLVAHLRLWQSFQTWYVDTASNSSMTCNWTLDKHVEMPAELEILEVSVFNICSNTLVFRGFTDIKRQKPAITRHILAYLGVVSKFNALFCLANPNPILPASTIALRELTSCQQRLRVSQGPFRLKSGTFKPEIGQTSHGPWVCHGQFSNIPIYLIRQQRHSLLAQCRPHPLGAALQFLQKTGESAASLVWKC